MKKDPDALINNAAGPIDRDLLCKAGPSDELSAGYLHDASVLGYLSEDESIEYLLSHQQKGIELSGAGQQRSIPVGDDYRSVMVVTPRRVFWVAGNTTGDTSFGTSIDSITEVTFTKYGTEGEITVVASDIEVHYTAEIKGDPNGAVEYIRAKSNHIEKSNFEDAENTPNRWLPFDVTDVLSGDETATASGTEFEAVLAALNQFEPTIEEPSATHKTLVKAHSTIASYVSNSGLETTADSDINLLLSRLERAITILDEVNAARSSIREELPTDVVEWMEATNEEEPPPIQSDVSGSLETLTSLYETAEDADLLILPLEDDIDKLRELSKTDQPTDRREALLAELESVAEELERVPEYSDMHDHGQFKAQDYTNEFGSWMEVVEAAGFDMRARLISQLQTVADDLDHPPSKSEVGNQGEYHSGWYDKCFESWEEALTAADIQYPSEEELEAEIHRLHDELDRPPIKADIEAHSEYTPRIFRQQLGSVRKAAESLGYSYREDLLKSVQDTAIEVETVPKLSQFSEHSRFSQGLVYELFDSWDEALQAADVNDEESVNELIAERQSETIDRNPFAELYEAFRMLRLTQETLFDGSPAESLNPDDPMAQWYTFVEQWVSGDGPTVATESYEAQQATRTDVSMSDYRTAFGNGELVLEFQTLDTKPVPQSIQWLLRTVNEEPDINEENLRIPVAPTSDEPLPVLVETTDGLTRARQLLNEFPDDPATSTSKGSSGPTETTPSDDDMDGESADGSDTELTEIGGVTSEVAEALQAHGFNSHDEVANASVDEIASIPEISETNAARIVAAASSTL